MGTEVNGLETNTWDKVEESCKGRPLPSCPYASRPTHFRLSFSNKMQVERYPLQISMGFSIKVVVFANCAGVGNVVASARPS